VRLLTTADLDRRTKASQIALEIRSAIMADLGGEDRLSTLERLMVENAAFSSHRAARCPRPLAEGGAGDGA
jgi:hypothetical protein